MVWYASRVSYSGRCCSMAVQCSAVHLYEAKSSAVLFHPVHLSAVQCSSILLVAVQCLITVVHGGLGLASPNPSD